MRETIPDAVLGARRRGRADRPHPGGAARAPARRQGLPVRAHRRGAQQLLPDREPRRAARGRAAPGRRGGRRQAPDDRARRARARRASPPTRRRPSASACSRSSSPTRAPSGSCAARGARRSASAPSSTCCGCARRGRRSPTDEQRSLAALRQLASVLGARMLEEESDDLAAAIVEVASRGAARTYILMGALAPAAGPCAPAHAAAPAADAAPARRRRAHRRRPHAAPERSRRAMSVARS